MRISDWSSDVCSSDLSKGADPQARRPAFAVVRARPGLAASTGERPALSFCRPHPLRRHGVDLKRGNVLMSVILFSAAAAAAAASAGMERSEEHTSELQSLMRISYAVFCLKKKKNIYLMQ